MKITKYIFLDKNTANQFKETSNCLPLPQNLNETHLDKTQCLKSAEEKLEKHLKSINRFSNNCNLDDSSNIIPLRKTLDTNQHNSMSLKGVQIRMFCFLFYTNY